MLKQQQQCYGSYRWYSCIQVLVFWLCDIYCNCLWFHFRVLNFALWFSVLHVIWARMVSSFSCLMHETNSIVNLNGKFTIWFCLWLCSCCRRISLFSSVNFFFVQLLQIFCDEVCIVFVAIYGVTIICCTAGHFSSSYISVCLALMQSLRFYCLACLNLRCIAVLSHI